MAKCSQCEGCGSCETRGGLHGLLFGLIFAGIICMVLWTPRPEDKHLCLTLCEEAGHSVYAFDLQRGCVCSDPFPEVPEPTRKWVKP